MIPDPPLPPVVPLDRSRRAGAVEVEAADPEDKLIALEVAGTFNFQGNLTLARLPPRRTSRPVPISDGLIFFLPPPPATPVLRLFMSAGCLDASRPLGHAATYPLDIRPRLFFVQKYVKKF